MKTILATGAVLALLAGTATAAEPQKPVKLTEAQMDDVSAGIFRLPRVDSFIRLPRLPRVPSVPSAPRVDSFLDLRALLGR